MKLISETKALTKLRVLKTRYQNLVKEGYEHKAKDCLTCEVQGSCCVDAHFVNVHITRLEAVMINEALQGFGKEKSEAVFKRIGKTVDEHGLDKSGDDFGKTFACPLFEQGTGCLVHKKGKPIPCIQHACYENESDLPPDELQLKQEKAVELLNTQAYRNAWSWLPLPVWLQKLK